MKRRLLSIVMVIALLVAMLAGCKSNDKDKETNQPVTTDDNKKTDNGKTKDDNDTSGGLTYKGIDISKEVKLKMYLLGDRTKDFDLVYSEINKILKEKVNATVEVDFLSWSDHDTRYSLLFSGGEDFDLIFTASSWGHYEETASMGGFYELTEDFIKTYAPDIWEVVPEAGWSQALVDNKVYMVPNYQNEFAVHVLAVRGDLMEKYGFSDITSWNQLIDFYEKVAENETGITPLGTQGSGLLYPFYLHKGVDTVGGTPAELFVFNTIDPDDLSISFALDWDGFIEYANAVHDMYNKGFWSADSMATTEERQDSFLKGTAASMVWNLGTCQMYANQANQEHPEWKCTVVDIASHIPKGVNPYINNGIAINATSKNKERAMMVLNEFYTNPEVFDLAMLGVEGVHWEAVGDDQFIELEKSSDYGVDSNCNWGWTNMEIKRTKYNENPTIPDLKAIALTDLWNENIKPDHIYDGFTFDSSKVSSEIAAVDTVLAQYYNPIIYGMAGDVDKAISELRKQLENAGINTIYEEIKAQAAAFVDNN